MADGRDPRIDIILGGNYSPESIQQAQADIDLLEARIQSLTQALGSGTIGFRQFEREANELVIGVGKVKGAMDGLATATTTVATVTAQAAREIQVYEGIQQSRAQADQLVNLGLADQATKQQDFNTIINAGASYAADYNKVWVENTKQIVASSRAVSDFSRGLEFIEQGRPLGALRSLPHVFADIASAAGAGPAKIAGILAAADAAAAALLILYNRWDDIRNAMSGPEAEGIGAKLEKAFSDLGDKFSPTVKKPILDALDGIKKELDAAKKEVKDLGDRTSLTITEFGRFEEAKDKVHKLTEEMKVLKDVQDLMSDKSDDERKLGKEFKETFAEIGGVEAKGDLLAALQAQADATGKVFSQFVGVAGGKDTPEKIANLLLSKAAGGDRQAMEEMSRAMGTESRFGTDLGMTLWQHDINKQIPGLEKAKKARDKAERQRQTVEETNRREEKKAEDERQRIDKTAQDFQAARDRERERKVNELARQNEVAVQGAAGADLTAGIINKLGTGFSPAQIAKNFQPEAERRLRGVPGMDPAMVADVARKVVADEIAKQAPRVAARGAGPMIDDINAKVAGQEKRVETRETKQREAEMMPMIAGDFMRRLGANQQQSLHMAKKTMDLMRQGYSYGESTLQAYMELTQHLHQIDRRFATLTGQLHAAVGQYRHRRGHVHAQIFPPQ